MLGEGIQEIANCPQTRFEQSLTRSPGKGAQSLFGYRGSLCHIIKECSSLEISVGTRKHLNRWRSWTQTNPFLLDSMGQHSNNAEQCFGSSSQYQFCVGHVQNSKSSITYPRPTLLNSKPPRMICSKF